MLSAVILVAWPRRSEVVRPEFLSWRVGRGNMPLHRPPRIMPQARVAHTHVETTHACALGHAAFALAGLGEHPEVSGRQGHGPRFSTGAGGPLRDWEGGVRKG